MARSKTRVIDDMISVSCTRDMKEAVEAYRLRHVGRLKTIAETARELIHKQLVAEGLMQPAESSSQMDLFAAGKVSDSDQDLNLVLVDGSEGVVMGKVSRRTRRAIPALSMAE